MNKLTRKIGKAHVDWDAIKVVVFDCDGVLTDGSIILSGEYNDVKRFCAQDGMGIYLLIQAGLIPVVITGRKSIALARRCEELHIQHLFQGVPNKLVVIDQLLSQLEMKWRDVAYMGDDWNDIPSMAKAAISACPADAPQRIREIADWVSERKGGKGAVRDYIELILQKKRIFDRTIEAYLATISK